MGRLITEEMIDYMIQQYSSGEKNTNTLSKELDINSGTVIYYLHKYGVKTKPNKKFVGNIEDYEERILTDFDQNNLTMTAIGKKYGISIHTIERLLWKHDRDTRKHCPINPTPAKTYFEEMRLLYEQGNTLGSIAKQYGYSDAAVRNVFEKNGIEIRGIKKYFCNDNFFETIDSQEKAYFLGLLLSDGTVSLKEKSVRLYLIDRDSVEQFKRAVEFTGPIHEAQPRGMSKKIQYFVTVRSLKMVEDLCRLGCIVNKTFEVTWPSFDIVPNHLIFHFLRGYIDGDGSITSGKHKKTKVVHLVANIDFLLGMKDFLNTIDIHSGNLYDRWPKIESTTRQMSVHRVKDSIKFLNLLYQDATVYMERKYLKYCEFRDYMEEKTKAA